MYLFVETQVCQHNDVDNGCVLIRNLLYRGRLRVGGVKGVRGSINVYGSPDLNPHTIIDIYWLFYVYYINI